MHTHVSCGVIRHPVRLSQWIFGVLERVQPHTTSKSHAKCDTVVLPVLKPNKITHPIGLTRKQDDPGSKAENLYYTTSRAHLEGASTGGRSEPGRSSAAGTVAEPGLLLGREISDRSMAELVVAATAALRVGLRRVRPSGSEATMEMDGTCTWNCRIYQA